MSIREEFEKIDPTEKQKNDIFRRIEESGRAKDNFRHQVIRCSSLAAAAVFTVGAVTLGVHFATNGDGIDYTASGNSSSSGESVADSAVSRADYNTSHADNSSVNDNNTIYSDINKLKAQVRTDKEFWAEIGKQYGPYNYEHSRKFDFVGGFDDFKLCTDEAIGNEIIDRIKRQWTFDNIVDFNSGYYAVKGARGLSTSEDIEKFTQENLINGEYFEADPEFFGFSDMKGFYDAASELYTGFDYDDFRSFIPDCYEEVDGKLCIAKKSAFGEKGSWAHSIDLGQYLLIYDDTFPDIIYCFVAVPEIIDSYSYSFSLDFYVFVNTENGLRCSVSSTITNCGLRNDELYRYVQMSSERLDKKMYLENYSDYSSLYCEEDTYNDIINNGLTDDEYNEIVLTLRGYMMPCTDENINRELRALAQKDKAFLDKSMNRFLPNVVGVYENDELFAEIISVDMLDCYPQKYRLYLRRFGVEKTDNGYRFIK